MTGTCTDPGLRKVEVEAVHGDHWKALRVRQTTVKTVNASDKGERESKKSKQVAREALREDGMWDKVRQPETTKRDAARRRTREIFRAWPMPSKLRAIT